ncbi:(deoxy)nucleoside triphosphate pyrophosphohydrolase [Humibacter sp.]|jgi:8-oxo-dGTP diphosphatase|uniref:(deoxy)nucleoside triphosphate pyrophosphohydrolase n=1 Tax=Humibacter sp. TaxID=1940291 RepID=UPI002C93417D|nr:NUDIX domain-containing protein [Humibacter sp.]HVX09371.1 NUDIX domain-containing protein [Humibacter sp.]
MRIVEVVAAVVIRDDRVLGCRRNPAREAGGLWEFPGGKVEFGEAPADALAREIREELGVDILVGSLLHRGSTPVNGRLVDLSCYWARLADAVPTSSTDHDLISWFRRNQLRGLTWAEPDLATVALLSAGSLPEWI